MDMNGMYGNYYDPSNPYANGGFQAQAMFYGGQVPPQMTSSLTDEEIQRLRQNRPGGSVLNLSVDPDTIIRSMCNHRDKGQDMVQVKSDGSGEVWCPICGATWSMEELSREEVEELVKKLVDQMQITKWAGNIPTNVCRDYFTIMPLLEKFPDLWDYSMKNFNRMMNANGMYFATDATPYAQYNSMFPGGSMNYNVVGSPYVWYPQPGYVPQGYQQGMPGQPMPGQAMGQMANPAVNPMQAQAGFNTQFANQQAMMMNGAGMMPNQGQYMNPPQNGGYYQQMPGQQQGQYVGQPYQANFGVAQAQTQQQTPPAQQTQGVTTETKVDL